MAIVNAYSHTWMLGTTGDIYTAPLRRDKQELKPGISWMLPHVHLPFAHFNQYPFPVLKTIALN